jgi:FKBP-type peptidyl-prolyl cis-trans isomerase 2
VLYKNKWVTFALIAFIAYSYFNQPQKKGFPGQQQNNPLVNALGKEKSLVNNEASSIQEQGNTPTQDQPPPNNLTKSTESFITSMKKDPGFIEKKMVSVVNNLLETDAGKQFLDKLMSTAVGDSGKVDFTTDPYYNRTASNPKIGEGSPAICGQTVTINYLAKTTSGKVIENTKEEGQPKTITLGKGSVIKGLEYAVIGMRKGGMKSATVQPSLAYDDEKFVGKGVEKASFIGLEIELIDLSPEVKINQEKIQIFEKIIGERKVILKCGDTASIYYRIKKNDGTLLYDSAKGTSIPKILTIGDRNVPFIINRMLENMGQNASRTSLVPIDALNNLESQKTNFFPDNVVLPKQELIIVEVDTVKPS